MYKDTKNINHRNETEYLENIKLLSKAIKDDAMKKGSLKEFLLEGATQKYNQHHPKHKKCTYVSKDKDHIRVTEKRICRCMYYYNVLDDKQTLKCKKCNFIDRWKNNSDYEILDYEVPMEEVWDKVGGFDLLIKNNKDNIIYAVELKPEKSKETLVRMVAEILTYSEISNYQVRNYGKIVPAICFFKGSKQWNDYEKFKNNPDFKILTECVQFFCITHTDSTFEICKMNSLL